jgi:hypothetical protein
LFSKMDFINGKFSASVCFSCVCSFKVAMII